MEASPVPFSLPPQVDSWSVTEVSTWLEEVGFSAYVQLFHEQNVDGEVLLQLTEKDMKREPLMFRKLGDIKKLGSLIKRLKSYHCTRKALWNLSKKEEEEADVEEEDDQSPAERRKKSLGYYPSDTYAMPTPPPYQLSPSYYRLTKFLPLRCQIKNAFLSSIFLGFSILCTTVTMTFVHERVPDQQEYRPLPDLFLDNIKHMEWAFILTEVIGLILLFLFFLVLLFNRYRFIMLWRVNVILGTILLLRCITMLLTSMSVPGVHIKCSSKDIGVSLEEKLKHAWHIASGLGMSLNGVRTCGDYMFSAHTAVITILNFAVIEYTPDHWKNLHVITWILNTFGMFFVLASHEHYSIDVFVAFYIAHRLFIYYHSLANSNALQTLDKHRLYSFFPLFSFFEEGTEGKVPIEFEWPWKPFMNILRKRKSSSSEKVDRTPKLDPDVSTAKLVF